LGTKSLAAQSPAYSRRMASIPRDAKFGAEFDRVAKGAGINVLKTAVRAPLMNSTCERLLGSVRRECLDHIIILSEPHLRSVLNE
jgi:putative transposase